MANRTVPRTPKTSPVPQKLALWLEEHIAKPSAARLLQVSHLSIPLDTETEGRLIWRKDRYDKNPVEWPYTIRPIEAGEYLVEVCAAAWTAQILCRYAQRGKRLRRHVVCPKCARTGGAVRINEITGTVTCWVCDWWQACQGIQDNILHLRDRPTKPK